MIRTCALVVLLSACAYLLPPTWRAFRAHPDDAAPAVTRALDAKSLSIESFDQANSKITTGWLDSNDGVDRMRQRYVISWERDDKDGTLTVYVRHEAQEQELEEGRPSWGSTYHEVDKEAALLDQITKELKAMSKPM